MDILSDTKTHINLNKKCEEACYRTHSTSGEKKRQSNATFDSQLCVSVWSIIAPYCMRSLTIAFGRLSAALILFLLAL